MTYKVICDNCAGNGYLNIKDNKGEIEVKQCWTCESEGELTYDEKDVKKISDRLCDTYNHKQLH